MPVELGVDRHEGDIGGLVSGEGCAGAGADVDHVFGVLAEGDGVVTKDPIWTEGIGGNGWCGAENSDDKGSEKKRDYLNRLHHCRTESCGVVEDKEQLLLKGEREE